MSLLEELKNLTIKGRKEKIEAENLKREILRLEEEQQNQERFKYILQSLRDAAYDGESKIVLKHGTNIPSKVVEMLRKEGLTVVLPIVEDNVHYVSDFFDTSAVPLDGFISWPME